MNIPDLTNRIIRPDDQYYAAGGFGDVFRCRYTSDEDVKEVAVKAFRFSFSVDENKHDEGRAARMIRRELGIWRRLDHPNIVPFLGIAYGFGRQGSASLVSMWMPHGTLHTFLEAHADRLGVAHRLQLLLDIAEGLHYLHSFPVIHGDLTSNNVLLDHGYSACLTDFGCASLVGELPQGFTYLKMSTVRPGTLRWAAPEHFPLDEEETKNTIKSDVYSFGNMALLVLSGKYPWDEVRTDAAVVLRLSQGIKPARPATRPIDDRHWALIERCWSPMPERPLAEELSFTLRQLLEAYSPPQPLHDLLDIQVSSSGSQSYEGDGRFCEPFVEDGRLCSDLSDSNTSLNDMQDTVATPGANAIGLPSHDRPVISEWVRGEFLAGGTYGCVYLGHDPSNGKIFAVKQVDKGSDDSQHPDFVSALKMEREIISKLHHPHIIAYFGSEETETALSIFMEYIPRSIEVCLIKHGRFNEEVTKSFASQIFDGLAYLHANRIIHRNIESGNILVDESGICKLSGFGNAQRADGDRASSTPMRGTMFRTAPEVSASHGGKRYGPKVDVWSVGCVLLGVWAGDKSWWDSDITDLVAKDTKRGVFPSLPSDIILSDLAVDFKNRCFVTDPEARASAVELLQHPYLALHPDWVFTGFK